MFCKKVTSPIKKLVGEFDDLLIKNEEAVNGFLQNFKKALESPVIDAVEKLIPGDLDDKIVRDLKIAVDVAIYAMIAGKTTNYQLSLVSLKRFIEQYPQDIKDALLNKFAALILKGLDRRYKINLYDAFTQLMYTIRKNK